MRIKIGSPKHVALWRAVNEYVMTCGGDPTEPKDSFWPEHREAAVSKVETALEQLLEPEWVEDSGFALPVGTEAIVQVMGRVAFGRRVQWHSGEAWECNGQLYNISWIKRYVLHEHPRLPKGTPL